MYCVACGYQRSVKVPRQVHEESRANVPEYEVGPMDTKRVVSLPLILAIQCFNLVCVIESRPVGSIVVHSVVIDGGADIMTIWLCDQWCTLKNIPEENALTLW